ncbi:MAG TPA: hypothetical protein VFT14_02290 [Solirubrobacterales bacterium]|nr:hypothetical protein [Solirubrobacterales bacterium]
MRRIAAAAALTGVGVLVARAVVPKLKLHERLMTRCERMFQQMPEDFPPKRIMRGIEEIRADTRRTVELLEEQERERAGEAGPPGEVSSTEAVGHAA